MSEFSVTHLSDTDLKNSMLALVTRDRVGTALLLAHLAEFEARKLYLTAGYSSMFAYCVQDLNFSEPSAWRRIQAARLANRFPALYPALSSGRLHLCAVCALAPHVDESNASELIEAVANRSKREIEAMLLSRFPGTLPEAGSEALIRRVAVPAPITDVPPLFDDLLASPQSSTPNKSAADDRATSTSSEGDTLGDVGVSIRHKSLSPVRVDEFKNTPPTRAEPEAEAATGSSADPSERYLIRVTVDKDTHDRLREAQELLSHSVRSGDVAQVLNRALDLLVRHLKSRRIGSEAARKPSRSRGKKPTRYISTEVRRAVWKRDGGRCTFLGVDGHRCDERRLLEFDHIQPFARGGRATVEGLRLRCRAHNQYEAERSFGPEFMERRRREAKARRVSKGWPDSRADPGAPADPESRADPGTPADPESRADPKN